MPADIRHCLKIGVALAVAMLSIYLAIGLITVIVWSVRNHAAVVSLFELSGMETGSRILTTVAMLIWLPNVMLWAVSWLFGGGFAIGDLASFTLWLGQSKELPAIPVFGILPEPSAVNYGVPFLNALSPSLRSWACWLYSTARIRLQTVECTEYVHPRPGTGFADLLRRGILPERDADLTGIHIAVRSVQWIAWRSSSCSHRRRRHGLHQSRRSFDRTGTYRGMAARADWHSARFSDSLVG